MVPKLEKRKLWAKLSFDHGTLPFPLPLPLPWLLPLTKAPHGPLPVPLVPLLPLPLPWTMLLHAAVLLLGRLAHVATHGSYACHAFVGFKLIVDSC